MESAQSNNNLEVAILDDDEFLSELLGLYLKGKFQELVPDRHIAVSTYHDSHTFSRSNAKQFSLLFLDLRLQKGFGSNTLESTGVLKEFQKKNPEALVVLISALDDFQEVINQAPRPKMVLSLKKGGDMMDNLNKNAPLFLNKLRESSHLGTS